MVCLTDARRAYAWYEARPVRLVGGQGSGEESGPYGPQAGRFIECLQRRHIPCVAERRVRKCEYPMRYGRESRGRGAQFDSKKKAYG